MTDTEQRTDFLFTKRNFWTGFGSILSIGGDRNMFNASPTAEEADRKAIESDWKMVGSDISHSLSELSS